MHLKVRIACYLSLSPLIPISFVLDASIESSKLWFFNKITLNFTLLIFYTFYFPEFMAFLVCTLYRACEISERLVFTSRGTNMVSNLIKPYIRRKVCVQTLWKTKNFLKLVNFTRVMSFWLDDIKNVWHWKKPKNPILGVVQLQNFKIFLLLLERF